MGERKIGVVADEARDVILLLDSRGHVCDANRAALAAYGYDHETLTSRNIRDLRAPSSQDDLASRMKQAYQGGVQFETVHRRSDGSEFACEVSSRAVLLDGDSFLVSVIRDLTERKRAEETLRQTETLFAKVFHASPVVVSIIDLQTRRYVDVNPSFSSMLELPREAVIGKTFADLGLTLEGDGRQRLAQALEGEFRGEFELRIRTPSGRLLETMQSLDFLELGGRPCVVAFAHDVTEHKRLEQQLQHAQKMEAIGRLAGGVAHDFNNILTAIRGHSEILLQYLSSDSPHRRQADQIHRAALRAAALTGQLLAFSRKQAMQPRIVDLNGLVSNLTAMLHRLIGEDVELRTELAPELGRVRADPGQLEQVLLNLVVNARDAMPTGGVVTVGTRDLDVESKDVAPEGLPMGRWVLIEVRDTGVGIDATTRARIFEPFFTTKERGKGTGLGLSTVYGIVTQSGGHVDVQSVVGSGSTFRVLLPRVEGAVAAVTPPVDDGLALRGHETVLLVEDDTDVREFVHGVLQSQGYRVLAAADGPQALRLVAEHPGPIELLVTDVIMPKMIGSEVAARVATLRPAIKVLYISGYPGDTISRQVALAPEHVFVQKPFSVADLARHMRALLDGPETKTG